MFFTILRTPFESFYKQINTDEHGRCELGGGTVHAQPRRSTVSQAVGGRLDWDESFEFFQQTFLFNTPNTMEVV